MSPTATRRSQTAGHTLAKRPPAPKKKAVVPAKNKPTPKRASPVKPVKKVARPTSSATKSKAKSVSKPVSKSVPLKSAARKVQPPSPSPQSAPKPKDTVRVKAESQVNMPVEKPKKVTKERKVVAAKPRADKAKAVTAADPDLPVAVNLPAEEFVKPEKSPSKSNSRKPQVEILPEQPREVEFQAAREPDDEDSRGLDLDEDDGELFEPKKGRGGRSTRAPRSFEADDEFLQGLDPDLPIDEEDSIIPDAIDIDPLDVPLELLDPDLVEVPRPNSPPKPKPKPSRADRRQQKCDGCGQMYGWISVDKLCFNCLKRKLAQRKSQDETYSGGFSGSSGGGGGESDDDDEG